MTKIQLFRTETLLKKRFLLLRTFMRDQRTSKEYIALLIQADTIIILFAGSNGRARCDK